VDAALLAALAEPNRLRIVELLNEAPRPVGEVATALGLRQPQATKHLQTLQRAGLVVMHPLGQRRIYALRREQLQALARWFDELGSAHPSEGTLDRYTKAIARERDLATRDPNAAVGRTLQFVRELRAPVRAVWAHWTSQTLVQQWWSPEHFIVTECEIDAVVGRRLQIVMAEGDGSRYLSRGRFLALAPYTYLRFELAQLAAACTPLLSAIHDLRLEDHGATTQLTLLIHVTAFSPAGTAALAGMEIAWEQQLGKLERILSTTNQTPDPQPNTSATT